MRNLNAAECVLSSMLVFSLHSSASVLSPPFNIAVKPRPHCVCMCVRVCVELSSWVFMMIFRTIDVFKGALRHFRDLYKPWHVSRTLNRDPLVSYLCKKSKKGWVALLWGGAMFRARKMSAEAWNRTESSNTDSSETTNMAILWVALLQMVWLFQVQKHANCKWLL